MQRKLYPILVVVILLATMSLSLPAAFSRDDPLAVNKDLVRRNLEAFNASDWNTVESLLADDFVLHFPLNPEPQTGPEALLGFFTGLKAGVPDFTHPDITLICAENDLVAVLMSTTGTFSNEWNGISPNNGPVTMPVMTLWRVADGKLAEAWIMFDTLLLMQQLGVAPVAEGESVVIEPTGALTWETDPASSGSEANKAVVLKYKLDVINAKNFDLIPDLFSTDFVYHDHGDTNDVTYEGHQGVVEWLSPYGAMMPDLTFSPNEMILVAENDVVYIYWIARGTHTGDVPGIPASGNEVVTAGATFYRMQNGKIAEAWFLMDTLGFMQQIGVIPTDS